MDRVSCLYRITSPSGKSYIGVTHRIARRLVEHRCAKSLIGSALRKYGDECKVEVLVVGPPDYILGLEHSAIEIFGALAPNGYNIAMGGIGGAGCPLHPDHKAKLSESHKGVLFTSERKANLSRVMNAPEYKTQMSVLKTGKAHSPETKAKIAASRIGKIHSQQTKAKMSVSQVNRFSAARGD